MTAQPHPPSAEVGPTADADRLLRRFLRTWAPKTVLCLGSRQPEPLVAYQRGARQSVAVQDAGLVGGAGDLSQFGRFDLAVVADQLERIPHRDGVELLGRLKNLHTDRVCVLLGQGRKSGRDWRRNDFLGLGFLEPRGQENPDGCRFFYYDLASYNPERRWNNPEGWANPENFRRYRW